MVFFLAILFLPLLLECSAEIILIIIVTVKRDHHRIIHSANLRCETDEHLLRCITQVIPTVRRID